MLNFKKNMAYGYNLFRSGNFLLQGSLLPFIGHLSGQTQNKVNYKEHLKVVLPRIQKLYQTDANNIASNLYPIDVLAPENPFMHLRRIPRLLFDAYRAGLNKNKNETKKFSEHLHSFLDELPDYYKRNFHFQDDGYLGKNSADLYEHQVEVLFSGSADAMRRMIIAPLKNHFDHSDGTGLHFLELGVGTGRLTKFIAMSFPKAAITCVDLSPAYLKKATKQLSLFERVNFVRGAAEKLNFKDNVFDAVYSCYMFHELPLQVRKDVLQEGYRVLKPKGFYGFLDSIQKNDDKELNWALDQFPLDFHEPFFKNYIQTPIEKLIEEKNFNQIKSENYFLTKIVSAVKN